MAKPKRPRDPNQLAKLIVGIATGEETETPVSPKDTAAADFGRKGGKKRAAGMSRERRSEIARKAAQKRWEKV